MLALATCQVLSTDEKNDPRTVYRQEIRHNPAIKS